MKWNNYELPYLLRYVPDWYKTQQMCQKAIWENGGTSEPVSKCYKLNRRL